MKNMSTQMSQKELYEWIRSLGFCAYDMLLYLDTHPDDEEALNYFNQCNEFLQNAKKVYAEQFEPLSAFPDFALTSWKWNTAPMPWEGGM